MSQFIVVLSLLAIELILIAVLAFRKKESGVDEVERKLDSSIASLSSSLEQRMQGMEARLSELDRNKPVYVICQSGLRSYIATRILTGNGFECYNFAGGFRFYDAVYRDKAPNKKSTPCGMEI